ncbi:MAG: LamG-like jellyroll fold domain-containing protein [Flavobacteriales bacterium]
MKKTILLLTSLLIAQFTFSQNGLNFDGANDVVQTTYSGVTGTANRTFEAWIYLAFTPSANSCILDYGVNAVGARNTFYVNAARRIGFISGGTNANISSGTTNTVPLNVWTHVAFVLDNGTGYLYINGVQAGTGNLSNVNTPTTGTNLRIGNRVTGGNIPYRGVIDEVRIWDMARTQTEIASSMNLEFCIPPANLKAYYQLNQGTAGGTNSAVTTASDNSANSNSGTLTGFALTGTTSNWVLGQNLSGVALISSTSVTSCGSYTMPNGTVVSTSGTYYDTIGSSSACDSLDSYVVNITNSTITNVVSINSCVTYTTPLGNNVNASGTYFDTVATSTFGCDSLIQYDVVISSAVNDSVYRTGGRIDSYDVFATHQWVRCDSNFAPIAGETNRFIIATQAGDYAVIVSRGSCIDTSDCINIQLSSLSETSINNLFEVYPNPASSFLTINNLENRNITAISIIDIRGKLVTNKAGFISKNLNIQSLERGVYFLKIETKDGVATIRFVKN